MQTIKDFLTSSRVKSFLWRLVMMFLAGGVDMVTKNLSGFDLGPNGTIVMGLFLGEVSKAINNSLR